MKRNELGCVISLKSGSAKASISIRCRFDTASNANDPSELNREEQLALITSTYEGRISLFRPIEQEQDSRVCVKIDGISKTTAET
jgi:hypothetical protein